MLSSLFKLFLVIMLGLLAYDISQTGSFQKTQTMKYLESSGALKYVEFILIEIKNLSGKGIKWAEANIPQYYNDTCIYMKPYINLSCDLGLICKNAIIGVGSSLVSYLQNNFPEFQNQASIILSNSLVTVKEGAIIISNYISDLVTNVGKYANEMFKS